MTRAAKRRCFLFRVHGKSDASGDYVVGITLPPDPSANQTKRDIRATAPAVLGARRSLSRDVHRDKEDREMEGQFGFFLPPACRWQ